MTNDYTKKCEITKIREFIYEGLNEALFEAFGTYWVAMESNFLNTGDISLMNRFFCDFLTIQNNGIVPAEENIANNFISYFNKASRFQKKEIILRNIYRYSVYFLKLEFSNISDPQIREKIEEINTFGAKDAYPFLMEVLEDYDYAHINKNMLLDILNTVIGFIEDRNSLESLQKSVSFAGLSSEINKMMVLKDYVPKFVVEERSSEKKFAI